ncbi:prepilin-type N-terminal cleavage/methylation domain-containing protein [Candidatus Azambacteria bacterium]|nr:prepilin-type N-terminal cleavage/methylation domain-containing protein [Candidatus Azambacteria bacterium]
MKKRQMPLKEGAGFTLLEMLVSIGIFALFIGLGAGLFLSVLRGERHAAAFRAVQENIRFSMETMAREMRTGKGFSMLGSELSFTNARGESVRYRLRGGAIERSSDGGLSFGRMTSDRVNVATFAFRLAGEAKSDQKQPRFTMLIDAKATDKRVSIPSLHLQTTITQREIDS